MFVCIHLCITHASMPLHVYLLLVNIFMSHVPGHLMQGPVKCLGMLSLPWSPSFTASLYLAAGWWRPPSMSCFFLSILPRCWRIQGRMHSPLPRWRAVISPTRRPRLAVRRTPPAALCWSLQWWGFKPQEGRRGAHPLGARRVITYVCNFLNMPQAGNYKELHQIRQEIH